MKHHNALSPPQFPDPWASEWGEDRYGLWQTFVFKGVRHAFRWIPPADFMMGSPKTEKGRFPNEDLHRVMLSKGFWIAETTVTQALWSAVMAKNPSAFEGNNRPVESVSWEEIQLFIQQFNQLLPFLQTRLPWEAEWEYACRAATQTPFNFAGEVSLVQVNYRGVWDYSSEFAKTALQETAEVKSYPCNNWGLYEMHGNVWEWCQDIWQEGLGTEAVCDPWQRDQSLNIGANRVLRGGSWSSNGRYARSAHRDRRVPGYRLPNIGFRLVLGHSSSDQGYRAES